MKKLIIILVGILLMGMSLTTTMPYSTAKHLNNESATATAGTFEGSIGPRIHGNQTVGNFSGTYELRNRGGRFTGEWAISIHNTSKSGTMRGAFIRIFILGRVTIGGVNRTMPIVGFIKSTNGTFVGRFMAPMGPALYFWGTYT